MKKFSQGLDIVTIGSVFRDMTFFTDEGFVMKNPLPDPLRTTFIAFEYGAKIEARAVRETNGGGACNTAMAFYLLGLNTGIAATVGKDSWGRDIQKSLKNQNIDTTFLTYSPKRHTGFSFLVADTKRRDHVIFTAVGANEDLSFDPVGAASKRPRWIYLSPLRTRSWLSLVRRVFERSQSNPIHIAWNPGTDQLKSGHEKLRPFLKRTSVLILNQDEAVELLYRAKKIRNNEIKSLLQGIHKLGPESVIVTAGEKGAYAYDGSRVFVQPAFKVKVKDTTGAGDAFGSTVIACLMKGYDMQNSLVAGAVNAASQIKEIGSQNGLMSWETLRKHLRQ